MKKHRHNNIWKRTIAAGVVCLFLANQFACLPAAYAVPPGKAGAHPAAPDALATNSTLDELKRRGDVSWYVDYCRALMQKSESIPPTQVLVVHFFYEQLRKDNELKDLIKEHEYIGFLARQAGLEEMNTDLPQEQRHATGLLAKYQKSKGGILDMAKDEQSASPTPQSPYGQVSREQMDMVVGIVRDIMQGVDIHDITRGGKCNPRPVEIASPEMLDVMKTNLQHLTAKHEQALLRPVPPEYQAAIKQISRVIGDSRAAINSISEGRGPEYINLIRGDSVAFDNDLLASVAAVNEAYRALFGIEADVLVPGENIFLVDRNSFTGLVVFGSFNMPRGRSHGFAFIMQDGAVARRVAVVLTEQSTIGKLKLRFLSSDMFTKIASHEASHVLTVLDPALIKQFCQGFVLEPFEDMLAIAARRYILDSESEFAERKLKPAIHMAAMSQGRPAPGADPERVWCSESWYGDEMEELLKMCSASPDMNEKEKWETVARLSLSADTSGIRRITRGRLAHLDTLAGQFASFAQYKSLGIKRFYGPAFNALIDEVLNRDEIDAETAQAITEYNGLLIDLIHDAATEVANRLFPPGIPVSGPKTSPELMLATANILRGCGVVNAAEIPSIIELIRREGRQAAHLEYAERIAEHADEYLLREGKGGPSASHFGTAGTYNEEFNNKVNECVRRYAEDPATIHVRIRNGLIENGQAIPSDAQKRLNDYLAARAAMLEEDQTYHLYLFDPVERDPRFGDDKYVLVSEGGERTYAHSGTGGYDAQLRPRLRRSVYMKLGLLFALTDKDPAGLDWVLPEEAGHAGDKVQARQAGIEHIETYHSIPDRSCRIAMVDSLIAEYEAKKAGRPHVFTARRMQIDEGHVPGFHGPPDIRRIIDDIEALNQPPEGERRWTEEDFKFSRALGYRHRVVVDRYKNVVGYAVYRIVPLADGRKRLEIIRFKMHPDYKDTPASDDLMEHVKAHAAREHCFDMAALVNEKDRGPGWSEIEKDTSEHLVTDLQSPDSREATAEMAASGTADKKEGVSREGIQLKSDWHLFLEKHEFAIDGHEPVREVKHRFIGDAGFFVLRCELGHEPPVSAREIAVDAVFSQEDVPVTESARFFQATLEVGQRAGIKDQEDKRRFKEIEEYFEPGRGEKRWTERDLVDLLVDRTEGYYHKIITDDNNNVAGYAVFRVIEPEEAWQSPRVEIVRFRIHPAYDWARAADTLMKFMKQSSQSQGYPELAAFVHQDALGLGDVDAEDIPESLSGWLALLKEHGFEITGEPVENDVLGEATYYEMVCDLSKEGGGAAEPPASWLGFSLDDRTDMLAIESANEPAIGEKRWTAKDFEEALLASTGKYSISVMRGQWDRIIGYAVCRVAEEAGKKRMEVVRLKLAVEEQDFLSAYYVMLGGLKDACGKAGCDELVAFVNLNEPTLGELGEASAFYDTAHQDFNERNRHKTDWQIMFEGNDFKEGAGRRNVPHLGATLYREMVYKAGGNEIQAAQGSPAAFVSLTDDYQNLNEIAAELDVEAVTLEDDFSILTQAGIAKKQGVRLNASFKRAPGVAPESLDAAGEYLTYLCADHRENVNNYTRNRRMGGRTKLIEALREKIRVKERFDREDVERIYKADALITKDLLEHPMVGKGSLYTITVNPEKLSADELEALTQMAKRISEEKGITILVKTTSRKKADAFVFRCIRGRKIIGKTSINLHSGEKVRLESLDRTLAVLNIGIAASSIPGELESREEYEGLIELINRQYALLDLVKGKLIQDNATPQKINEILHQYPIHIILPPIQRHEFQKDWEFEAEQRAFEAFA